MRVTRVDMYSSSAEEPITFSLNGGDSDAQYQVRVITGLDAEAINQAFYGMSQSGEPYYNFSVKSREIVMRVVLRPRNILGETYSDVRDELYKAIAATRQGGINLHFVSGSSIVSGIGGYISKFEVAYFDKLPEVQLTVDCPDGMFRGVNPVILTQADDGFGSDYDPVIDEQHNIKISDSLSTSPHGFVFSCRISTDTDTYTIQEKRDDPEWMFKLVPDGGFLVDDDLYISSEFSNKFVYINRDGSPVQIANAIDPESIWPILFPGANGFWIPELGDSFLTRAEYYPAYWGV